VIPESGIEVAPARTQEISLEAVATQTSSPAADEREILINDLARLQDRRQRLLEMQAIDEDESRVRGRLAELDTPAS
jgi:hypothetical protein